ncbi:MAG: M81 family metallopeptidase [Anaerolineae bacterium]
MRIAVAGIAHETNTFSPIWTEYEDFVCARGADALRPEPGDAPLPGDVQLLPVFVAHAHPGGLVRRSAYEALKDELLRGLAAALPLDGIYLVLHGAMEVEGIGDGEGDLITAVRALVGERPLISVSLDLHGNISPTLVAQANMLTALRTAPHRDGAQTRRRALDMLVRSLHQGLRPVSALVKLPLLLAGEAAMTTAEPAASLYDLLPEAGGRPGIMDASLLVGCAWTDSAYTSASVIVVAEADADLARRQAEALATQFWARRHDFHFGMETAPLDEAIRRALAAPERPVYITDSGDNVTAGAAGDITLCAERLLALGAQGALVAGLCDPEAVGQCAAAGVGAHVHLSIGGKLDPAYPALPVSGEVLRVVHEGGRPALAAVRLEGVTVILAADRRPFTDRAGIAAAGVDPMWQSIVVVKQGYLFPDLLDHAPRAIMALTPGATDLALERLPYLHLRRPIFPLDQVRE